MVPIPFVPSRKNFGVSLDCPARRDEGKFSGFGTVPQDSNCISDIVEDLKKDYLH